MSRRNYYTTTALVATLALGFPHVALAQDATADPSAQVDPNAQGAAAGASADAAVAADPSAQVDPNAQGAAAGASADPAVAADPSAQVDPNAQEAAAGASADPAVAADPSAQVDPNAQGVAAGTSAGSAVAADPSAQVDPNAQGVAADASTDAEPTEVTEGTIGTGGVRTSTQEFDTQIDGSAVVAGEETGASAGTTSTADDGMTRFDQTLMLGLGAVAVGSLLNDGSEVVANTGDRVVVNRNGQLVVYKDDNALLFREGSNVRTETFADGSTRTFVARADGGRIVTIRDREGRVLRRTQVAPDGTEVRLFDDTIEAQAIDASQLANYARADSILFSTADQAALRTALMSETNPDRRFSVRQIRENEEVRNLVAGIDLDTINFATGSSALRQGDVETLRSVGATLEEILRATPGEVFMIEGHTDAVGDAVSNLTLSDRRAETVALALTENFAIAPENLLVQGYGEQFLKVETQEAELANRRATVRRITPLLQHAAAQ